MDTAIVRAPFYILDKTIGRVMPRKAAGDLDIVDDDEDAREAFKDD